MSHTSQLTCDCGFHSDGDHAIIATTDITPAPCGNPATWVILRDSIIKKLAPKASCDECLDDLVRHHRELMPLADLTPVPLEEATSHVEAIKEAQTRQPVEVPDTECWCYHGPAEPGLSGHEFTPFDEHGNLTGKRCSNRGAWLGTWNCGGCPDTHTVQVCTECRTAHDADAATGLGIQIDWEPAGAAEDEGSLS